MTTGTPRLARGTITCLACVTVWLAGCSALGLETVVIHEGADPEVTTTVQQGLFFTKARIGALEAGGGAWLQVISKLGARTIG
jgi:hypothetical protein